MGTPYSKRPMSPAPAAPSAARCQQCGAPLAGATCPRCALSLASEETGFDEDELGLLFPELHIIGKIARGGFGTVYRAEHRRLQRPVALKFLDPDIAGSREGVARFEQEMAAVGKLDHPGIVRAHDAGERAGHWYIVMEFVHGEDVATLARRKGKLPVEQACHLVRQAALALAYAHGQGLVHRDVKPGNLMLAARADGGEMVALSPVKVLDFGLAASADKGSENFQGTPDYAAPEQINTPADVDARADIYGLGATLFRLLTGVPPRPAGGELSISSRILRIGSTPAPPIASLRADLPAGLAELCDRMLAMDRAQRPATAAEVAELLTPYASAPRPRRRRLWPLVAALPVLAALAGWFFFHPKTPSPQSALPSAGVMDDDLPPLRDATPPIAPVPTPAPPGLLLIDDNFDDGLPGTNTRGRGHGFTDPGQEPYPETDGLLHLDTARANETMVFVSPAADAVNPFLPAPTRLTCTFGTISRTTGSQRLWIGYRRSGTKGTHYFPDLRPDESNPPARGLYLSILSQYRLRDGLAHRGNLIATDAANTRTLLASWKWADPDQLSGLTVHLTTTATTYQIAFTGAPGGIPLYTTGGPTGPLTGLGDPEPGLTYDIGGMNQYINAPPGGVTLDRITLETNIPPAP